MRFEVAAAFSFPLVRDADRWVNVEDNSSPRSGPAPGRTLPAGAEPR
jgi:hypothetical protein